MGISRDSRHKRRLTGGRMSVHKKKRAFEKGRPMAHTKLGDRKIRKMRVRGGNYKFRALRLNCGNFNWCSEGEAMKSKINNVVYNASNNDFVRTNILVKNAIVLIDATPFKNYLMKHYFGCRNEDLESFELNFKNWYTEEDKVKKSSNKYIKRRAEYHLDHKIEEQLLKGQILACISSRPGQSGRADGFILEGKELEFYLKKIEKK